MGDCFLNYQKDMILSNLIFVFFICTAGSSTLTRADDDILSSPEYDDLIPKSNYEWHGRFPKWIGKRFVFNPNHNLRNILTKAKLLLRDRNQNIENLVKRGFNDEASQFLRGRRDNHLLRGRRSETNSN